MIPKILHQIWIGDKKIPLEFLEFSKQWRMLYPDYDYILWDDTMINNLISVNLLNYYNDNRFPTAFKADILRYEIIKKYGGIYIDMDTEPLRRMPDDILHVNLFSGIQNNGEVSMSIFGAVKNNDLMITVIDALPDNIDMCLDKHVSRMDVHIFSGPPFFDNICKSYKNVDGYMFYDTKYFYPYWYTESHRRNENFKITCPEAYSVHHWCKSWSVL